jgi:hypothetical protein
MRLPSTRELDDAATWLISAGMVVAIPCIIVACLVLLFGFVRFITKKEKPR